jgi:monothiol glutaredoxin
MSINARIEQLLQGHKVLLFMKGTPDFPQCGFSGQAVQILGACATEFDHFNIFEDSDIREGLKSYSNWPTYPQLYINGELIGGCDIMIDLYKKGELVTLLTAANAVVA